MASAFSVRSQNKTDLVPNSLVGNNDSKFISMTPSSGINFYDSVSTILASISWNGISTNNPNGFDIQSPLNMNNNNINNVNTINGTTTLTLSGSDIYTNCQGLQLDAGLYINLDCNNGDINLTSSTGKTYINLSGVSTGDGELVCSTYSSVGDISISALSGGVVSLNSGDNTQITCGENFSVNTNATTGIINMTAGATTGSITLDSSQIDINGGLVNINANSTSVNMSGHSIDISSSSGVIQLTSNNDKIGLDAATDINLVCSDGGINLTATGGFINMYSTLYLKDNASPIWDTSFFTGGFNFNLTDLGNLATLDVEGATFYLQSLSGNATIQPSTITIDTSIGGTASLTLNGPGGYALLGLTDGVNTNDITALGYTTINSVQNATQYLNFTGSSSTGVGAIQKTAGISCNPFYNTLSSGFVYTNLAIPTTITGATFSSGTLTLTNPAPFTALGQSITNSNNYFNITMSANITALTPVNFRINGMYLVYITGNATIPYTISSSLGSGIKTNYTIITVPATGKALMRINYDGTTYYVNCSLFS
jgi:hypothetical protein